MANTVLTSYGSQYVLSAGDPGPYIAIKYFVPVYDYRLDTNIHTAETTYSSTSAISYESTIATTSAQTIPTGEILWNQLGYNLSTNFIVSGTGDISASIPTGGTVSAYKQSSMGVGMNTCSGNPLWPAYYGTNFDPPSLSNNKWTITNISGNGGVIVETTLNRSKYYKVTDYYPVVDTSGNIRGAFKCHIDQPVGRFKFNKIVMYAVRVDGSGVEQTDEYPAFFGEAFIKETCVKSNVLQEGIDDFVIDVQLDLTPLNNYWVSGFYSTSGDYWARTVGGLYFSDNVGIGSFSGSTDVPQAKLHVMDINKSQLRLAYGTSAYSELSTDSAGNLGISATSSKILPLADNTTALGNVSKRWTDIHTNSENVNTLKIINTSANFTQLTSDVNGNLVINPYDSTNPYYDKKILPYSDQISIGSPTAVYLSAYVHDISATNVITKNVIATDLIGGLSIVSGSSTLVNNNISFFMLTGTCGATGDLSWSTSTLNIPSIITSANILSFNILLESCNLGGGSFWVPPGSNASITDCGYYANYVYVSGAINRIEIINRETNVNLTSTRYRIVIMFAT